MFETSNDMANALQNNNETSTSFKMAVVSAVSGDGVSIIFNGEESQREKKYKRLASYNPTVGDKVLVAKLNKSYTILGKVE